jgi:hypothetical protein
VIAIDPEFRDLIPALAPAELEQLHKSLCASGCYTPLIVWKEEGILIDGHNRYEYCRQHNVDFQTIEMRFSSRDVAKNWIILNQLGRRNVTPETASALRGMLYNGRKVEKGKNCTSDINQAEAVAKETGVSARTIKNDAKLVDALNKLGIPVTDWMAGTVEKSRKEIIEEAFPPKPKKEKKAKTTPPPIEENEEQPDVIEPEPQDDEPEPLVVDGTKDKVPSPPLTKDEILDDYLMSELARIESEWATIDRGRIENQRSEHRSSDQKESVKNVLYELWRMHPAVRAQLLTGIISLEKLK